MSACNTLYSATASERGGRSGVACTLVENMDVIKGEEAKRVASGGGHLGRRETSWDCGLL